MKELTYNFIYKTTNLIDGRIYIGHRSTNNLDDGYLGSSTELLKDIKLLGKENFKREILEFCNYENLSIKEKSWIIDLNAIQYGYNKHIKGTGQRVGFNHSEKSKIQMKLNHPDTSGENNSMYGRTGELNPMFGVHRYGEDAPHFNHRRTVESKLRQSEVMSDGRYDGEKNPFFNKKHSDESLSKMKASKKKRYEEFGSPSKGVPKSDIAKQHYKESWENRKTITCEHCGLESKNASNMKRYHGENCKYKN